LNILLKTVILNYSTSNTDVVKKLYDNIEIG